MTVNTSVSAIDIAQTLMGNSVKIDSAIINCGTNAYGKFNATNIVNLPFSEGVLLTTGNAQYVSRPANNSTGAGLMDLNLSTPGNTYLETLSNQTTEDACAVKVFLKPLGNQLRVDYVFASEEYPEQVNKYYYDAFAFLVSGPKPAGGFYLDSNIAKVGSGQPVTVATINNGPNNFGPCVNCNLYKNNASNTQLGYDGLTSLLSATIPVVSCQNYEITIVIADVKDGKYDSGVFLNKGAINSGGHVSLNASQNKICKGQSLNISASSNIAQNYSWSNGENDNTITISPLVNTTYTCFYTYCGINGYQTINIEVDTTKNGPSYYFPNSKLCKSDSIVSAVLQNGNGHFIPSVNGLYINANGVINIYLSDEGIHQITFISSDSACPGTYNKKVEVVAGPELSVNGGLDYCSNQSANPVTLSALGLTPFKFEFFKDSVLIDSLSSNSIISFYNGNGLYSQFKVRDKDGCSSTKNIMIEQKKLEAPLNNFEIIPGDSCSASGLIVQNLSFIERAIIQNYKWELNNQLVGELSDLELNEIPSGIHQLKLIAIADNGCSDTLSKSFKIKPSPVAKFNFNSPCFGDSVFINNISLSNSSNYTLHWQFNTNNNQWSTSTTNPKYLAFDSLVNVSLKIKNTEGCSDSVFKQIKTIPLPKTHFTFNNVCEGDTMSFVNLSNTISGASLYYSWDINNDGNSDFVSKDLKYFNLTPKRFWVKLNTIDEFGCKSNLIQMAEIYPKPITKFSLSDSSGCVPFQLKTQNFSSIENNGLISKYKWNISNGQQSSIQNPEFKLNKPGKYVIELETSSNRNCISKLLSDSILIVYPKTKPEFIIYPEEVSTLNNLATIEFKNNNGKNWVELNNEILNTTDGVVNVNFNDSGWYKITGIEQNEFGCLDTSYLDFYVKSDFSVYIPNSFTPNLDGLNELFCVVTNGINADDYLFRIVNRFNETVFASTTLNECWDGKDKKGEHIAQGVYVYELKCRTTNRVEKYYKGTITVLR